MQDRGFVEAWAEAEASRLPGDDGDEKDIRSCGTPRWTGRYGSCRARTTSSLRSRPEHRRRRRGEGLRWRCRSAERPSLGPDSIPEMPVCSDNCTRVLEPYLDDIAESRIFGPHPVPQLRDVGSGSGRLGALGACASGRSSSPATASARSPGSRRGTACNGRGWSTTATRFRASSRPERGKQHGTQERAGSGRGRGAAPCRTHPPGEAGEGRDSSSCFARRRARRQTLARAPRARTRSTGWTLARHVRRTLFGDDLPDVGDLAMMTFPQLHQPWWRRRSATAGCRSRVRGTGDRHPRSAAAAAHRHLPCRAARAGPRSALRRDGRRHVRDGRPPAGAGLAAGTPAARVGAPASEPEAA